MVEDLDILPLPDRQSIDYEGHPMPTASILGSRGCPWDCSFCSIRPFYEEQGGPLRRLRAPRAIVDEMIDLHRRRGVPIFLFQDDDFLAGGKNAKRWAAEIADLIVDARLAGQIAFKISCRSDEIHEDILERLIAGGLTHVYMGVESGDEEGLLNMSKRLKPEAHLRAGRILKQFGLSFDFGFMMVDPYSTFRSIRQNIDFLEAFIGDGWTVAPFCRMLPYAGTPIKRRLEAEGRLLGTPFEPDYQFLDPKLDLFYDWMVRTFYDPELHEPGPVPHPAGSPLRSAPETARAEPGLGRPASVPPPPHGGLQPCGLLHASLRGGPHRGDAAGGARAEPRATWRA